MSRSAPLKLAPIARTDAELKNTSVAHNIVTAADHRRMGEPVAQLVVAQAGVRIKVDNGKLRIPPRHGAYGAERDKMFAAD